MLANPPLLIVMFIAGIVLIRINVRRWRQKPEEQYCLRCGTIGVAQYQQWRKDEKRWVCPKCEQPDMIPLDSPKAKEAILK